MAKRASRTEQGSKADAIREMSNAMPGAKNRDIIAALKDKGIDVSAAQVSTLLKKEGRRRRRRKKGSKLAVSAPVSGKTVAVAALVEAKKFAAAAGGLEQARQALDAWAKLR